MNLDALLIVVASAVLVAVVVFWGWWWWTLYGPRPVRQHTPQHAGADDDYAAELHAWNTSEQPMLMTHAQYLGAGRTYQLPAAQWPALEAPPAPTPAELDLVQYASGGAFTPVPYAVEGEVVEPEPDPLTVPADEQVDAHIFDDLMQSWDSNLDVEWRPSWASFTGYWETVRPARGELVGSR